MNKQEATRLLALIKLSYPNAYRDMDDASKKATVNMWHMSFPEVPYQIMEQAFNHFRMVSKFPPTVAEMVDELRHIHFQAEEGVIISNMLGDRATVDKYRQIMECTQKYTDARKLGGLNLNGIQGLGAGYTGACGQLGTAERAAIRRMLAEEDA